ncbi:MAG: hypothetical protein HOV80_24125 [Polyangiaceae bacterium]|nr:hypothetical protein [Polyangiaceae bacterium]
MPAVVILWGFTVDDALIPARYAHHLATGRGYVFNPGGPSTDGVTPLGFAHLLAPFAKGGAMAAFTAARFLGAALSLAGAAAIGARIARIEGSAWKWLGLLVIATSAPFAAWAGAGLETGSVAGLVALGVALRHGAVLEPLGTLLLALAAGMRPELLPFAVIAGVPSAEPSWSKESDEALGVSGRLTPNWGHLGRLALVVAPFVVVATVRMIVFGRPTPLAALAKPSSLSAGLTYAAACFLLTGPPALLAAWTWRKIGRYSQWLLPAIGIHFVAIGLAGGDWMPLSRLAVAVVPVVALVAAEILATGSRIARLFVAAAVAAELFVWTGPGYRSRRVLQDRATVIEEARPMLAGSKVIGSLDIGWVGAAAPEAAVVDFAGVSDPIVAALPGGHTSKPVPDELLAQRDVDTIVMLIADGAELEADWTRTKLSRGVERWIALSPWVGEKFEPIGVTEGRLRYLVLQRRVR